MTVNVNSTYLSTGVGLLKIGTVILGLLAFITGFFSHFGSDWRRNDLYWMCKQCQVGVHNGTSISIYPYPQWMVRSHQLNIYCPGIWMEATFAGIITCSFILSLGSLTSALFLTPDKLERKIYRLLDFIFHTIFGILTIVAGSLFIFSAAKIDQFLEEALRNGPSLGCMLDPIYDSPLTGGKIVAGVLAIKLGLLYFITSICIFRESWDEMYTPLLE